MNPGYNEPRLYRTNLVGPQLFVKTEFDCISRLAADKIVQWFTFHFHCIFGSNVNLTWSQICHF